MQDSLAKRASPEKLGTELITWNATWSAHGFSRVNTTATRLGIPTSPTRRDRFVVSRLKQHCRTTLASNHEGSIGTLRTYYVRQSGTASRGERAAGSRASLTVSPCLAEESAHLLDVATVQHELVVRLFHVSRRSVADDVVSESLTPGLAL